MPELAKLETPKSAVRPPPLPSQPAARGGALAHVRAFLTIRRIHLAGWLHRHKAAAAFAGVAILLAAAGGTLVALDAVPEIDLFSPATVGDAQDGVRARPNDAEARRDLGHALWDGRKRRAAVASYARALALDGDVADERMARNLVAAFGTKQQREAEALLVKYRITAAAEPLEALVGSRRRTVRWGAVGTLDKLGKGTRASWETAYIADLGSSDCGVRRTAVDKLGAIGTRRALAALRATRAEDEKTGGWFRGRCLGERIDGAEQKIVARR
jgi:hypothetical protein